LLLAGKDLLEGNITFSIWRASQFGCQKNCHMKKVSDAPLPCKLILDLGFKELHKRWQMIREEGLGKNLQGNSLDPLWTQMILYENGNWKEDNCQKAPQVQQS